MLFPAGEVKIDINVGSAYPSFDDNTKVTIHARFGGDGVNMSDEIMKLLMVNDALRRQYPIAKFALAIPYIPYGRQDRVCVSGESLSLKVFGDLINSMKFDYVETIDPHSNVTGVVINNLSIVEQFDVFKNIYPSFRNVWIVAPDQGAVKRCEDFAVKVAAKGVLRCMKNRNLKTGKIEKFELIDKEKIDLFSDDRYLVLDDLCDKGGTFLAVADQIIDVFAGIRDSVDIDLAITHGLFTSDESIINLLGRYDNVYTSNSFRNDISDKFGNKDRVKVIDLFRHLA